MSASGTGGLRPVLEATDAALLVAGAGVLVAWCASLARGGRWRRPLPLQPHATGPSPLVLAAIVALYLILTSVAGNMAAAPEDVSAALAHPGSSGWYRVSAAVNAAKLLACLPIPLILARHQLGDDLLPGAPRKPRFRRVARNVFLSAAGMLAMHLLTTAQAYFSRWVWVSCLRFEPPPIHDVLSGLSAGPWSWSSAAQLYLIAVVIAPLAEELFFRGLLCGVLRPIIGVWGAIAVNGLLFGLVHVPQWTDVGPLMTMGVALGYLRFRASLPVCVGAHALFNARTMIFATLAPEALQA